MFQTLTTLRKLTLHATDGDIGPVRDFYFDDEKWAVRYLMATTGGWLTGRDLLLSPASVKALDPAGTITTDLSRQRIEQAPKMDAGLPIAREREEEQARHYGWPHYWGGLELWGGVIWPVAVLTAPSVPGALETAAARPRRPGLEADLATPHLRSAAEVCGYAIHARDGTLGHVEDFLIDPRTWKIEYLAVNTSHWFSGRIVLVPRELVDGVSGDERVVTIEFTREQLEHAPDYDPDSPFTEERHEHLRRCLQAGEFTGGVWPR